MATQTAPLDSVEDLRSLLGKLWAERRHLEKELGLVKIGIQTADENARSLKKRLARDDTAASSLLDRAEAEHRTLTRKEEGLRLELE
jgi:chromosome segregation ATPase